MLPEILCIVKQQNQAQYDFVKLEINSVLSYSLLVRDGSFCLSFVASLKQRSWTSKVYCMSSKLSRSRLMSPNNKITILLQAKHVLVIRAIAWMYLTSLIRNECWQNSWWEDNTLQWLFKRLFVPLRPRLIFFTFSFISCCVSLSIPPTFIPVISRVSSRHLSYFTTCDHFVFTLALLDASSKPFPLRYLCFLALFLPFRSAYIPKFFPLRSACFRSRLYYLEPPPPFPPPPPLLPWVPLWKTLFPGSVCFRERGETRPDRTWHKWFKEQSDSLIFDNQCDTTAFKISTRNVWFLFCSVIGPLAEINFPLRAAPVCHYGTCSCVPRVS